MGLILAISVVFGGAFLPYNRQDAAGDQLIGQLRHFRLQWSVGRGALEPLRRLVFWCGPR
jgi:hypothetical protein